MKSLPKTKASKTQFRLLALLQQCVPQNIVKVHREINAPTDTSEPLQVRTDVTTNVHVYPDENRGRADVACRSCCAAPGVK